jgi:murein L,D-transpeptidase YafK
VHRRHPIVAVFCLILLLATATPARPQAGPVDRILIEKSAHTMKLMRHNDIVKTYKVSLSRVPVGAKQHSGDHRVPEGEYFIDSKNHFSTFHLALHISYPSVADRRRARKRGVDPGGNIEIHGLGSTYAWAGSLHRTIDWTDGCIAVTNPEIEEIFPLVPVGTPVEIRP